MNRKEFESWAEVKSFKEIEQTLRSDDIHKALDKLQSYWGRKIIRDPLFKQWAAQREAVQGGAPRITEPWQAFGEQKGYSILLLLEKIDLLHSDGLSAELLSATKRTMGVLLAQAQTFLWTKKIFDLIKGYPLPDHIIDEELLEFPISYHSFEVAYDVSVMDKEFSGFPSVESDSFMLIKKSDRVIVNNFLTTIPEEKEAKAYVGRFDIPFGVRFPRDFDDAHVEPVRQLLSMMAFLKSPYTSTESRKIPRAFRRHGGCAEEDKEKTINVVILRSETARSVNTYDAADVEYKNRWWVRGHFRAQWYPSKKAHKVIWIAPHMKGPEGAPILEKVYAVRR